MFRVTRTYLKGHFPILTCLKEKLKSKGSFSGVEEAHTKKDNAIYCIPNLCSYEDWYLDSPGTKVDCADFIPEQDCRYLDKHENIRFNTD